MEKRTRNDVKNIYQNFATWFCFLVKLVVLEESLFSTF